MPSEISRLDQAYVWRPYTSSEDHEKQTMVFVGAHGCKVQLEDGRELYDATGSWWTNNLGYAHPRLQNALIRQTQTMPHIALAGGTHRVASELAEELIATAPKGDARRLARVFYSDNGSTSVEVAMKMAVQYWAQNGQEKRIHFLALPGSYHGDTLGAMSVSAMDFSVCFTPLLFQTHRQKEIVDPAQWDAAFESLIEELHARKDELAGVIVEPIVQGAAGMRMYPESLLRRLRLACDETDTFLIADEVFTGVGRTGPLWACERAGVVPDLLCASKGLTGGNLPFAATLATDRIYEGFRGNMRRALLHGHTYTGNPLGAAVALETLRTLREDDVLEGIPEREVLLREAFEGVVRSEAGRRAGAQRARTCGMIAALDLGDGGYYSGRGWQVHEFALQKGLLLRPLGDTLYFVPPLNIEVSDLQAMLTLFEGAIADFAAHLAKEAATR